MEKENLEGERLTPDVSDETTIEHLHRYGIVIDFVRGKSVLDIACGEGYGSNILALYAQKVVGVDIDKKIIDLANIKYKKGNLNFLQGSVDDIPAGNAIFDVVVSFETIEHHKLHEAMLAEIKRVLKNNGVLIISTPDKDNYTISIGGKNPFHLKELYLNEFKMLINKYFKNAEFYLQKIIVGSVIVKENNPIGFTEHFGDFNGISFSNSIRNHLYNICIASNSEIKTLKTSFFEGRKMIETALFQNFRKSYSYRIGHIVLFPLMLVKKLLAKWLRV